MKRLNRYLSALVAQGLVSVFHLIANLFLIRRLPEAEYGAFALAFALSLIAAAVTNALFTVPLSVLRPRATDVGAARDIDATFDRGALLVAALGTPVAIAAASLIAGPKPIVFASILFIATYAIRQHGRGARYAEFAANQVVGADLAYVAAALATAAPVILSDTATASRMLGALAVGNVVSTAVLLRGRPRRTKGRSFTQAYRPHWADTKWTLLGAVSTMVVAQGHSVIVAGLRSPEAFAPLAAGFVIFGPVRVLFATVQNVLRPEMASALAAGDRRSATKQAVLSSGASFVMVGGVSLLAVLFWNQIGERLYEERYGDEPMAQIVAMWAIVSAAAGLGSGPSALLQALARYRSLALVGFAAGMVNLVLVTIIVLAASVPGSVLAVAAAETFAVVGMVISLTRPSTWQNLSLAARQLHTEAK